MTQPIGELTDRMRDVFGLVVEAYLERGAAGRLASSLAGSDQPLAGLDPQRDAGSGGTRAARPTRIPPPGGSRPKRASACSSTGSCRRPRPTRASGAAIERQIVPRPADRGCARGRHRGPVGPVAPAPASCWCRSASRCCGSSTSCRCRASRALAVLVGADGSVENRVVDLPPGVTARDALAEVGNYRQRAPGRTDAGRSAGAAARRDPRIARRRSTPRRATWSHAASPPGAEDSRAARC